MIESGLPYSVPVRLHQAGAGLERHLEPDAAERAKIAKSLDLASLDAFDADGCFRYGKLELSVDCRSE